MIATDYLVTLIIPIYNVEKYLYECLDSITKQIYKNLEIILIDDGSTDESGHIADEFSKNDKRIKIVHKKNEGVSIAKNTGIELAKGDYVVFLDADDYIRNDFISTLLEDINKNNALIVTTPKTHRIDKINVENIEIYSQYQAIEKMFYGTLEKSENGVQMFDRQLIVKNKILFDPNKKVGEDFDFLIQALIHCDKVVVDYRRMYYYRPNPTSTMHQKISTGLMNAVENFSTIGEVLIKKYPELRNAVDAKIFNDSVALKIRSYDVSKEWTTELIKLNNHIRSLKWKVLLNTKSRKKIRIAAFVYCLLGNYIGTMIIRRIKR